MFERAHHVRIAGVLDALDAELLAASNCYFAGGTAIALRYGEYRESKDIDFLVADDSGYGDLREKVRAPEGFNALTRRPVAVLRPVVADQYGVRTLLDVDGEPIRFEIVSEGRIALETPSPGDSICGVATLTALDMATSKLLANSDRWADRAVFSRDVIDLAMMEPGPDLLSRAIAKAESAYRSAIIDDLNKAIDDLRDNPHRLDDCMRELRMYDTPKAVLWDRIKRLRP
ncbi:nucleotidyl transferase AbiEii/AbiGii toxin family protein [Mycolicibacter sp. MYC123]|uniref:Nucleotidyl transferase AbiEii/AbiGii toxin family protein n=1 Tax=[Mycobacterium] zoologicum TaxID=2872311 RepID=A0ABU5YPS0_9MYCO|nr:MULTISPECIES: nucleotidyl transferase AbiEii/AbiGii toxin family protein [unclassified Mycolicibacter]MEB3052068.1 nucleotidyl transferase AbiEii/AbiGii toxin family protein [Mycolicibacter sp. MYC123]MEB3062920.1 nucleotidyl transferase AbiEii/AbiGii toxin family protein [Mycolicibacter sp. MYC101]